MIHRETAMRQAFGRAVYKVVCDDAPIQQERLVKRVARVYDRGAGLRHPRSK